MRVIVLGATGPTGILVVREFLRVYPEGSAVLYVRNPSKIPQDISSNAKVSVVKGELTDKEALTSAFESGGQVDAVLSALGPLWGHPATKPLSNAYGLLIPIMAAHNSKRLIALSTVSVEDKKDKWSFLNALLVGIVWLIQRNAYRDIVEYAKVISSEGDKHGVDYTIVRVPNLNDKPGQKVIAGYVGDGKTSIFLSRHAIAEFYVREIEGKDWVGKTPAISSK